ncbi:MAG: glutathione S-transferase family protein [Steroidobacteraceae bacterium]|nr:glutathione S-transferase family protein [Steroidobacteraceae bacterium]
MLKIYGIPLSVHTRKVIVAALVKNLPHEVVPVVPVIPDNPPPEWRTMSPTGKIPAIVDGDFRLADSAAICAYFERVQPMPSLYPTAPRDYATALAFEQYAGALFSDVVRPLFHETVVHPKIRKIASDRAVIDSVLRDAVPESFGHLDAALRGDYLAGHALSIADIAVASNLVTYRYLGFDLYRDRFPRLAAHFDRVLRHPAMRAALQREQPFVDSMGLDRTWHVQDR